MIIVSFFITNEVSYDPNNNSNNLSSQTLLEKNLTITVKFPVESNQNQMVNIQNKFKECNDDLKKQKEYLEKCDKELQTIEKELFKNVKKIIIEPSEEIKNIIKDLKSAKRSKMKRKIMPILSAVGFVGVATGSVMGLMLGITTLNPGIGIIAGILGFLGGVALGGVTVAKTGLYDYSQEQTLSEKKEPEFYMNKLIFEKQKEKIKIQNNLETIEDFKDFLSMITLSFIAVPMKKAGIKKSKVYEFSSIMRHIENRPSGNNCPYRTGNLKKSNLIYELDYLPKLIEKVYNLITKKVLNKEHIISMKLILYNLHKFRKDACKKLIKIVAGNFCDDKIDEKSFIEISKFLKLESKRCADFLYCINEIIKKQDKEIIH